MKILKIKNCFFFFKIKIHRSSPKAEQTLTHTFCIKHFNFNHFVREKKIRATEIQSFINIQCVAYHRLPKKKN